MLRVFLFPLPSAAPFYPPRRITRPSLACLTRRRRAGHGPRRSSCKEMLAAEKAQLRTSLAVESLQLRDKELNYYLNTMSSVSTQATLLAGFAFAQLTGYEYDEPDDGYFTLTQLEALGIGHVGEDASARGVAGWSWLTWTKQLLQLCFIVPTYVDTPGLSHAACVGVRTSLART